MEIDDLEKELAEVRKQMTEKLQQINRVSK
jgi:hypothetical protein